MTTYAGEEFRITATVKDFDNTVLTEDNVNDVVAEIYDCDTGLVASGDMTWDEEESLWYYLWDSTGADPGTYKYRVVVTGADGKSSWEWGRARLSRNPFAA
jgi:hypothetical protein